MRILGIIAAVLIGIGVSSAKADSVNLFKNGDFQAHDADGKPADYQIEGDAEYRFLGNPQADFSNWGVALEPEHKLGSAGLVSQTVNGIDASQGRWFRFTFRGLPQANFNVEDDDLVMKVEFFGDNGRVSYDGKSRKIYDQIQQARKDLTVNGTRHLGGAEVWTTYQLDFYLPFPQVTQLIISVGFDHGAANKPIAADFYVSDFSLVRIPDPEGTPTPTAPLAIVPKGNLIPIGGRWFYDAPAGENSIPKTFDHTNAERLLYHDAIYSAPFAGNMTAVLRAGEMDLSGNVTSQDALLDDNVTVSFDATSMIIHTHGIPNHPTGRFPSQGFGDGNPNYIQEQQSTYYIPLNPQPNPKHFVTTKDNSNHALPMGPIGIAVNGVVFFNPFDANSTDATDLMDRCCGHPNPDGLYHYHKYPICVNSPWADEGKEHSPLLGWAFDGYPIYGPYVSANLMAKDAKGAGGLNDFNIHNDDQRGWHYQVTPGKFPYIIGGYWGTEDARDKQFPPGRGMGSNGPGGPGGPGNGRGFPPPPPFGQ